MDSCHQKLKTVISQLSIIRMRINRVDIIVPEVKMEFKWLKFACTQALDCHFPTHADF